MIVISSSLSAKRENHWPYYMLHIIHVYERIIIHSIKGAFRFRIENRQRSGRFPIQDPLYRRYAQYSFQWLGYQNPHTNVNAQYSFSWMWRQKPHGQYAQYSFSWLWHQNPHGHSLYIKTRVAQNEFFSEKLSSPCLILCLLLTRTPWKIYLFSHQFWEWPSWILLWISFCLPGAHIVVPIVLILKD